MNVKKDFPLLRRNKGLVYLDSAATSQKPDAVIRAILEWYTKWNANVHRGAYDLAERATGAYENSRAVVARFINAKDPHSIVFVKSATEAINLVANAWAKHNLKKGDTVLLTEMEHHANIVPWQLLAKEKSLKIKYWPIDRNGELKMTNLSALFKGVKLLGITHVSNVLGTINPLEKIIPFARQKGAKVLVDAAQSVPHMSVNVQKLNPDFLAFSSHKMLGPTGLGVLYIEPQRTGEMQPWQGGGEMISKVTFKETAFKPAPWKFEAGTQPMAQVFGVCAAIGYLEKIGMKKIRQHTAELARHAYTELKKIPEVAILGPGPKKRGALISFTVKEIHPHDLATFLNEYGVCIRAGHHCAQPLHDRLGIAASARVSFQIYNSQKEVDAFIGALKKIIKEWKASRQ